MGGVGVLDQQQEQGEGQTGGRIGLPAQQRGQEQQPLHHHCPDHRGGAPHRQGVEGQQRQGQEGSAAAVPPQELDGHPHQKGDVQAGDRHGMGQPGALEGPVVRVGQPGLVAGEEGPDQGRHLRREEGLHRPPQAPGPLGGPVSKGHPVRALHRQRLPIGVGPQEDAPGGAGLVGRAPDPIRRAESGGEGQPVAGGEPGIVLVRVEEGLRVGTRRSVDPDGDRNAVGGLPGPVLHRGGDLRPGVLQGPGGGAYKGVVAPAPQKARNQAQANQPGPQRPVFSPPQGSGEGQQDQRGRAVAQGKDRRGEGGREAEELTHGAAPGRPSGPGDSRCSSGNTLPAL